MTWVKIDDGMPSHRKWALLEGDPREWAECMAVWVAVACYAAQTVSDGFVEDTRIARLTPLGSRARQRCDDLVRVGLMEREEGGYRLHDWLHYQPSSSDVTRDREAARVRQKRARDEARKQRESRDPSRRDIRRDSHPSGTVSHGPPVPTRPVSLSSERDSHARAPSSEPARKAIEAAYRARKLSVPGRIAALTPSYEDSAKLAGLDMATLPGLLEAFFADPAMRAKGHPVGYFLENPNQWTPATAQAQTSTRPLPADLHDHERTLIVAAREGRWWRDREKWDRHYRALLERHPGIAPTPPWWSEEAA